MVTSFTSKILILCGFLILAVTVYYSTIYRQPSVSIATRISLTSINHTQCYLSTIESDGWFCESDSDWKHRKAIYHMQNKRNRITDKRHLFFQNNWEPTIQCALERRIGNTGDGGKWICDIHRLQQINDTRLLIYSFGSNGDFSFERATKEQLPRADIHTFDLGLFKCPETICTFHQARLGNGKQHGSKSLPMILNELGHQKREIHILKVDIEGSEFDLFEDLFNSSSSKNRTDIPYIRQILFEIHLGGQGEDASRRAHNLFELFRVNNYAIFHKEANLFDPQNVFEYALLRLNPAFFISPS